MDKQKLCPYCGCDQTTIRFDPRYRAAFVECDQCYAAGPSVFESDLMEGFVDTESDYKIKVALGELAVKRWNCRPFRQPPEFLSDSEQRIFLAAMDREEMICKKVDAEMKTKPHEYSLVNTCSEIVRKVKSALWKN